MTFDLTDDEDSDTGPTQSDSEEEEKSIAPPFPKYTTPPRSSNRKKKKQSPFSSVDSLTGSLRKMKMVMEDDYSFGNGTKENPKMIFAKRCAPEAHQPFIIHCELPMFVPCLQKLLFRHQLTSLIVLLLPDFDDMTHKEFVRSVWEIGMGAFVGDIKSDMLKAWIPTNPPPKYKGRVIYIKVPSIPFQMRDATLLAKRANVTCDIANAKRKKETEDILNNTNRSCFHYCVVFPLAIDHTVFKEHGDEDNEVHLSHLGLMVGPSKSDARNTWVNQPLLFCAVHWRVGESGQLARGLSSAKPKIDTNKMFV